MSSFLIHNEKHLKIGDNPNVSPHLYLLGSRLFEEYVWFFQLISEMLDFPFRCSIARLSRHWLKCTRLVKVNRGKNVATFQDTGCDEYIQDFLSPHCETQAYMAPQVKEALRAFGFCRSPLVLCWLTHLTLYNPGVQLWRCLFETNPHTIPAVRFRQLISLALYGICFDDFQVNIFPQPQEARPRQKVSAIFPSTDTFITIQYFEALGRQLESFTCSERGDGKRSSSASMFSDFRVRCFKQLVNVKVLHLEINLLIIHSWREIASALKAMTHLMQLSILGGGIFFVDEEDPARRCGFEQVILPHSKQLTNLVLHNVETALSGLTAALGCANGVDNGADRDAKFENLEQLALSIDHHTFGRISCGVIPEDSLLSPAFIIALCSISKTLRVLHLSGYVFPSDGSGNDNHANANAKVSQHQHSFAQLCATLTALEDFTCPVPDHSVCSVIVQQLTSLKHLRLLSLEHCLNVMDPQSLLDLDVVQEWSPTRLMDLFRVALKHRLVQQTGMTLLSQVSCSWEYSH